MKTVSSLNRVKKFALSSLLLLATNASFADFEDSSSMKDDLDKIKAYLQNLGMYFGYDLTNYCTTGGSCGSGESAASPGGATSGAGGGPFSNQLTPLTGGFSTEVDLITSFLGALLPSVPASNSNGEQSSVQLIPTTNASLSTYAGIINFQFEAPIYDWNNVNSVAMTDVDATAIGQSGGNLFFYSCCLLHKVRYH